MDRSPGRCRPRRINPLPIVAAIVLTPVVVVAQTSPFQTGATSLVTNFTNIATPFAALAVMVVATLAMMNRISWGWPIGALIGIGVIFGAQTIVTWARGLFGV
jgi:type IV secretory pathway VirB2 component (pilin)